MKRRKLPTKRKALTRTTSDVYLTNIIAQMTSESIKLDTKRKKDFGVA